MMDSFAIAYIPATEHSAESENTFKIEKINLNLWTQCGWSDDRPILDMGFLITNLNYAEKIRISIPFEIKKSELSDLCEVMGNSTNLLGAVFNEPYTSTQLPGDTKFYEVSSYGSSARKFALYKISFEHDVTISCDEYGDSTVTFIDIDSSSIDKNNRFDKYYIRFRIDSNNLKNCIKEYKAPNQFFETLNNSTYMVDLRFNNTRSMDQDLVKELTNEYQLAPVESLHFLLMTKAYVDVDQTPFMSSRSLEDKVWDEYIPTKDENKTTNNIIAYHHKTKSKSESKPNIGSWEFFTRMKSGKCTKWTVLAYVGVVVLINLLSSIIWDILLGGIPCLTSIYSKLILLASLIIISMVVFFWHFPKHRNGKYKH